MMIRKVSFYITILLAFLGFSYIYIKQLQNGLYFVGDTSFHVSRIYDIRESFLNHQVPRWLNFYSFFGLGQAINGMYPDLSLWPFVLLTLWMPFHSQVVAINGLIFVLTFCVTFFTLKKRLTNWQRAVLASVIYAFSGYGLYTFIYEFQPGVAIIYSFSFPFCYFIKDVLLTKKIDFKLIVKGALLFSIILWSHLLSAVVFALVFIIAWVINIIIQNKFNPYTIINMFVSSLLTLLCSMPIIYRVYKIGEVTPPFGKGYVTAESIGDVFSNMDVVSRTSLSVISILLLVIVLCYGKKDIEIIVSLLVEFVLILMCTNVVPWSILEKAPLLDSLQCTPWRFGIWLSIIPLFCFLRIGGERKPKIIDRVLIILAVLTVAASVGKFHDVNFPVKKLNDDLPPMHYFMSKDFNNIYNRILIRDYSPSGSNKVGADDKVSSHTKEVALNSSIVINDRKVKVTRKALNGREILYTKEKISSNNKNIKLPIYGYKSLLQGYSISINGKLIPQGRYMVRNGWLELRNVNESNISKVSISFTNPPIYSVLIVTSILITCLLIVSLKFI